MDTMLHPPFSYRNIYGKDSNDHSRNRYNPARCDGSRTVGSNCGERYGIREKPEERTGTESGDRDSGCGVGHSREISDYKELYIDADGSMYTPQTTPAIRGKAILYKNPYYKS